MKKLLSMAAAAVMVSAVAISNAYATYEYGQLGSGDIYRVRNVSDNQADFVTTANADCKETVQFKVRVHNGGPKTLNNVKVKATLTSGERTSHSSTVTVSADNNRENAVATGTAGVNLSKAGTISYVNGSTELLDDNGNKISTMSDTILTSGVNLGSVGVSLNHKRFVQFKAKVDCVEKPEVKKIQVCELETKKIITIDEKNFDATKHSKNLADCAEKPPVPGEIVVCDLTTKEVVTIKENEFDDSKYSKDLTKCDEAPVVPETPAELPQTGAEGFVGTIAALLTAGGVYAVRARKNLLG